MDNSTPLFARLTQRLFLQNQFSIKFGLEAISEALTSIGSPHHDYSCVVVAGTNGKGTTSSLLSGLLTRAGVKNGLYTSPHLVDFRERFRIHGQLLSEEEVLQVGLAVLARFAGGHLDEDLQKKGEEAAKTLQWPEAIDPPTLTFFELTTVMALELFRRAGVQVAVLEIGLGGRLDAVNVVEPSLTAITPIAMDHQEYLGNTLASVAGEKAAIMRTGVPCFVAPQKEEARQVLLSYAEKHDVPLTETEPLESKDLPSWLQGRFACNAALAKALFVEGSRLGWWSTDLDPEVLFSRHLEAARWPGRRDHFHFQGRDFFVDVAHNPAGAESLLEFMESISGELPVFGVLGMMKDKDVEATVSLLSNLPIQWIATQAQTPRAMPSDELAKCFESQNITPVLVARGLPEVLAFLEDRPGSVLLTGSVYLLGEWLEHCQVGDAWFALEA